MRRALPNSLNGMLLLGLAMVAIPLLLAILYATIQMRRFATVSENLVIGSVHTTRLTQAISAQIPSVERVARQYQVLKNPPLLASYVEYDDKLARDVAELRRTVVSPEVQSAIDELAQWQSQLRARVPDSSVAPLTNEFQTLSERAERIAMLNNQQIDGELTALRTQTDVARQRLFWEATVLVPLVLFAVVAFTFGLGRPLRQIDRAITELGSGQFTNEIVVSGPVDLERLGTQLEWLRNRLLELAQERNRFLRHMSHELKTPLANIREGTELLMDGAVGELASGQREVASILQENGIKLQRLIENVLSFSAWQSNSLRLELSEFRLRPLVKQVLENQQLTLVSQRARLDVRVDELTLVADRGKVRLILENLLSNAIKYSPRGGVIHVLARAEDGELLLDVADDGAGVPHAERPHIFDAFYTGRAPSGHVKGTGIGLSVVNEFVLVHRGSISIVDGQFPGAHFRVRLPLRAEDCPADPAPTPDRQRAHAA
jgi:two-component system sensor histidine kinase GlrK